MHIALLIVFILYVAGMLFSFYKVRKEGMHLWNDKMFGLPLAYVFCLNWLLFFDYIWLKKPSGS
jgi:tellurite resistance protein TehA-like permease